MAAFGLLLLIAAANVANMLLARAAARTREVAIRISVGASRGRLVQQLLTESAIIALAGGVCGSLLFRWWFGALVPWLLAAIPEADRMRVDATPDRTVLWFALGLTAVTTLLFGLVPALQASKSDVHALMKQDGAGTRRGGWLRGMLIGAQVALCTMLLIPAGLLSRALHAAHALDPGFDHHAVAVVSIDLRNPRYDKGAGAIFHDHWLERIRAVPGVERVAEASRIPLSPGRSQTTFRLDSDGATYTADVNTVSPDFFPALGLPIVRGRLFTHGEPDVLLVTESTARRYWPGQDAVGRRVIMDGRPRQVVGIVRDALLSLSPDAMASYVFLPGKPATRTGISVVARTRLGFDDFAAAVRSETISMDANLVVRVRPLSDNLAIPRTLSLMTAGIAATLSLLALGLAAIGIYGVVAYVVTRRRREVGIRLALGASVGDVRRLMLEQTLRPVAAGMAIGIAIAAAAARVLQSVLFGVSPFDLTAYLGGPLLLAAVAVLATWLPTRRALQTDPLTTLRAE